MADEASAGRWRRIDRGGRGGAVAPSGYGKGVTLPNGRRVIVRGATLAEVEQRAAALRAGSADTEHTSPSGLPPH